MAEAGAGAPGRRLAAIFGGLAAVSVAVAVFCGVGVWREARREAWHSLSGAARLVAVTARLHLANDQAALEGLGRAIARVPRPDGGRDGARIGRLGRRFSARHPEFVGLAVFGPRGSLWWRAGAAPRRIPGAGRAIGRGRARTVFWVGRSGGGPDVPLGVAVRSRGRVRFLIGALLALDQGRWLWPGGVLSAHTVVGLSWTDGRIAGAWPARRAVPAAVILPVAASAPGGRFTVDLGRRTGLNLGVSRPIPGYPFRAFALRPQRVVEARGLRQAYPAAVWLLVVLASIAFLYRRAIRGEIRLARERALAQARWSETGAQAEGTLQSLAEAVIATDREGRIATLNRAAERLTGWTQGEVRGRALNEVLPCLDEYSGDLLDPLAADRDGHRPGPGEAFFFHRDGRSIPVEYTAAPRYGSDGRVSGFVLSLRNAAEKRLLAERLAHQATHDALTELPNRILFNERLERALAEAKETGRMVALLFLDVDGFKRVNDTLGHSTGDRVLVLIAERLRRTVRAADTLGRLGGDEFAVVLPGLRARQDALPVVHKIMAIFREPLVVALGEVSLGVSVGIAVYPEDGADGRTLVRVADAAMYEAKAGGKNAYRFFHSRDAHRSSAYPLAIAADLRRALERDEFCLVYQPQVQAGSGRVVAMEALLRWMHPVEGVKYPGEFLLAVEEAGLAAELGAWVLRQACRQNRRWRDLGLGVFPVAVNVSGRQCVEAGLGAVIGEILREQGLTPGDLVLELAEELLVAPAAGLGGELADLRERGVRLAVQNFGGASSTLGMLQRLRVDALKIESTFIAGIGESYNDAVVLAVIALGRALDMRVIAAGVETAAQYRFLTEAGCDALQGRYIAAPLDDEAATAYLRARGDPDG